MASQVSGMRPDDSPMLLDPHLTKTLRTSSQLTGEAAIPHGYAAEVLDLPRSALTPYCALE